MLSYVALTRADDFLAVTGTGSLAFSDVLISNQKGSVKNCGSPLF